MPLSDNEDVKLVHAYLDGELDVATGLACERKLAANPALRQLAGDVTVLKRMLTEQFPPEPLSAQLRSRIESSIGLHRSRRVPRWTLMAASMLITAALSSALTGLVLRETGSNTASTELVDGHLRSLMAAHATDVISSDRHTVRPWFNGRTTQAPRVLDLTAQGFELVGGRIDVIEKTPLPTLVYRRRQHVISLTETSSLKHLAGRFKSQAENGFNVISWSKDERSYFAISDLNAGELETFSRLFRETAN